MVCINIREQIAMSHLALNVKIHDRPVLVVGGGTVACRKVKSLLRAGARVRLVTTSLNPELETLRQSGAIDVRIGHYTSGDLEEVFLVVAASDSVDTNSKIADDALKRGLLVNVTNAPELGNCHFPAILRRGDLEITVSSAGKCPAFSVLVRDYLAKLIGNDFGAALELLAAEREKLLTNGKEGSYNAEIARTHARRLIAALSHVKDPP